MRKVLLNEKIHNQAHRAIAGFHPEVVVEVEKAVMNNEWVIVGMNHNPVVAKARGIMDKNGLKYQYIGHGNYFGKWKERLAIKLWSGWPTFPQVFHNGVLVGGAKELEQYLKQ